METKANISFHIRAFAQVTCLALFLLDRLYRALCYLRGMLFRALVRMKAFVTFLFGFLVRFLAKEVLQVAERKAVKSFARMKAHNRKYALFTGSAEKLYTRDNANKASDLFHMGSSPKKQKMMLSTPCYVMAVFALWLGRAKGYKIKQNEKVKFIYKENCFEPASSGLGDRGSGI